MSEKIKLSNYDTLVLPGGAVKGFIMLGAIQAFLDNDLLKNIKTYVATSIGTIFSYLLAIGYTPVELVVSLYNFKFLGKNGSYNLIAMVNGNGAISFNPVHEMLEKMTINKIGRLLTLGKLRKDFGKTLILSTYNMTKCQQEYLNPDDNEDLPCITAIRMSSNLPLVYDRFKYMDNFYIDGCLGDGFPIVKACEIGNKVIGIYLKINEETLKDVPEEGIMNYFSKLLKIPVLQVTKNRIEAVKDKCTIVNIYSDKISGIDIQTDKKARLDMFSLGYSKVKEQLEL